MANQLEIVKEIKDVQDLKKHLRSLYIIHDYLRSDADYLAFQEGLYDIIKGCFEKKECREYPVKFKFYLKDKETYTMELRHFIVNVFAWKPFVNLYEINGVLDESFIIDCGKWSKDENGDMVNDSQIPNITDYINDKIISTLRDYTIRNIIVNKSVSEVLYNLRRISIDFSLIMNLTLGTESFLELYNHSDRMKQIMETKFPLNMQPAEIEQTMDNLQVEEIDLIKKIQNNPVSVILRANTGIKHKQLMEFTCNQALKPDLSGVTIPIPINSSTLIGGLDKPSAHYIDALGARKSLITNKKVMGNAGYFGKVCLELARTLSLSKTISDCNTKHLIEIEIKSKKMLKKYNGRYYKLNNTEKDETLLINGNRDTHLVGQKIYLRSPITCTCGNEVCHKCFGTTSLLNLDISDGVSGFEIEEVTKVVNQMILSTKHLLTTVSEMIEFNAEFYNFFNLIAGEINPVLNTDAVEDLDNWAIWIDPNEIQKAEELDDESSYNSFINTKFYVQNLVTKEYIEIKSLDERELFLTDECIELMKKGKGYIKFKDMSEDTTLFELIIMNNELTKPLYSLINLLNTTNKDSIGMTLSEMAQIFTDLLIDAGIGAMALSGELIINRLVRNDPDEDFERPDFSLDEIPPYQIYTVLKALEKNKSALIGISSQNIKRQLLSDELITKKTGTSYIDPFFKKNISTKRYVEIHDKLKNKK